MHNFWKSLFSNSASLSLPFGTVSILDNIDKGLNALKYVDQVYKQCHYSPECIIGLSTVTEYEKFPH